MTIHELRNKKKLINHEIQVLENSLTKQIHRHFKGIKPVIEHNKYGMAITVENDEEELLVYELDAKGHRYADGITDELADKIKNEYIEVYGEIAPYETITIEVIPGTKAALEKFTNIFGNKEE